MARTHVLLLMAACSLSGCLHNDRSDQTPPSVVTTTPADGDYLVPVTSQIVLGFNEGLDPDSLGTASFQLVPFGRTAFVDVSASYIESSRQLTLTPIQPLLFGARYTLTVFGVTDTHGNALSDFTLTFSTLRNPEVRRDNFNLGTQLHYTLFVDNDAVGNPQQELFYGGAGPDGQFNTADDVITSNRVYSFVEDFLRSENVSMLAGPDGIQNTADDVIGRLEAAQFDDKGVVLSNIVFVGPGPDAIWRTEDDEIESYYANELDARSNPTQHVNYDGPGPDGVWLTADDAIASYSTGEFDETNRQTLYVGYDDPGADGVWITADDHVSIYFVFHTDGNERYTDPGADGTWGTADDVLESRAETLFDADGLPAESIYYGPDGTTITSRTEYRVYNEMRQLEQQVSFGDAGVDGTWHTADDVISGHYEHAHDSTGGRTTWTTYNDPGPNGVWLDGDDYIQQTVSYDGSI